ncbi:hypothetical protein TREVI0001_1847 [Treponema vincentii ATCC 35580]|uniref:Uncharacterized protein n=1 Tax=Treponema vincentii ATCC 35580 TaxID=596324 RepID=C8PPA4_9SPIR|nr:hypothetical protein TREVI0001_1847 [Treponema vincentii ATCC 35580]
MLICGNKYGTSEIFSYIRADGRILCSGCICGWNTSACYLPYLSLLLLP